MTSLRCTQLRVTPTDISVNALVLDHYSTIPEWVGGLAVPGTQSQWRARFRVL